MMYSTVILRHLPVFYKACGKRFRARKPFVVVLQLCSCSHHCRHVEASTLSLHRNWAGLVYGICAHARLHNISGRLVEPLVTPNPLNHVYSKALSLEESPGNDVFLQKASQIVEEDTQRKTAGKLCSQG